MDETVNSGNRGGVARFLPVAALLGLASVAAMRLVPVLAFFYAIPVFFAFFRWGNRAFAVSIAVACMADALVGVALSALVPGGVFPSATFGVIAGSVSFFIPLVALLMPMNFRIRYRVALAGILIAVFWAAFLWLSGSFGAVDGMLKATAAEVSAAFKPYLPEGYDGAVLGMRFSGDGVYSMLLDATLYSALTIPVVMLTVCAAIGHRLAAGKDPARRRATDLAFFSVDSALFVPLACGMCGIIAGKVLGARVLSVVSWNVALVAGFHFFLQGCGIFRVLNALACARRRMMRLWTTVLLALVVFCGFLPHLIVLLLIVGVVELFVPIRARFLHTGADHPTPGPGGENL